MTKEEFQVVYNTLNDDQKAIYEFLSENDRLTVSIPTGTGKGYIMGVDLLNRVVNTDERIFAIKTHRLLLNNQHMNDMINVLLSEIKDMLFIFIGSSRFKPNEDIVNKIRRNGTTWQRTCKHVTNSKSLKKIIDSNQDKKIVMVSTYHSASKMIGVDIDTIFNDEAHILASASSDSDTNFMEDHLKLSATKNFYLTATPKDCIDDNTSEMLMNNKEIFGERVGLTMKECIEKSYMPMLNIHIATGQHKESNVVKCDVCGNEEQIGVTCCGKELKAKDTDYNSIRNKCKLIVDTFTAHSTQISNVSIDPAKIAPKMLVKCASVDEMWAINELLIHKVPENVHVFAGASRKNSTNDSCYMHNHEIVDKIEHLQRMQSLGNNDKAIILHFDTLSEGINVSGFTGTMFLSEKILQKTKMLQNTGRSTRLHPEDRAKIKNGIISSSDYTKWIKPHAYVIIPVYDTDSAIVRKHIAKMIKDLRDEGVGNEYVISIGNDMGSVKDMNVDVETPISANGRIRTYIKSIKHEIENIMSIEQRCKEQKEYDGIASDVKSNADFLKKLFKK